MDSISQTIVAQATPSGVAGVGVIRVSGPKSCRVMEKLLCKKIKPRYAYYGNFYDSAGDVLDRGIALFFPAPNSFTGEDVFELHCHGGPVLMAVLLEEIFTQEVRHARPGEFTERAFLNGKIDLLQAEATADLINSVSKKAARNAINSLQGAFSKRIKKITQELSELRVFIEAYIDFPEEEVDFLSDGRIQKRLRVILECVEKTLKLANQGKLLREGLSLVLAGQANVGKSTLLNALTGQESAITTAIPGTTRDLLRETILVDGIPFQIIDTAGLRSTADPIEQLGISRAKKEIEKADHILFIIDAQKDRDGQIKNLQKECNLRKFPTKNLTIVQNKIDLTHACSGIYQSEQYNLVNISAKSGSGIDALRAHLKAVAGYSVSSEGNFSARERHIEALKQALHFLELALVQSKDVCSEELLAEDLRLAEKALEDITGKTIPDDLLTKIFRNFCIGK